MSYYIHNHHSYQSYQKRGRAFVDSEMDHKVPTAASIGRLLNSRQEGNLTKLTGLSGQKQIIGTYFGLPQAL